MNILKMQNFVFNSIIELSKAELKGEAIEMEIDEGQEICKHCENNISEGACFYCKMD